MKPLGKIVGIVIHDTISKKGMSKEFIIKYCKSGSSIAPLYNEIIHKDGTFTIITEGKANHAGRINSKRYRRLVKGKRALSYRVKDSDDMSANKNLYAISIDRSFKEPVTKAQYETLLKRCRHNVSKFNLIPENIWGHGDLTKRKQDPYHCWTPDKFLFKLIKDLKKDKTIWFDYGTPKLEKPKERSTFIRNTLGFKNRNPGNIRNNPKFDWRGQTGIDSKWFCVFESDFLWIESVS